MVNKRPTCQTKRLILRPFVLTDSLQVSELAGKKELAAMTNLPHPYAPKDAEEWIATHTGMWKKGTDVIFAITDAQNDVLLGAIGLHRINQQIQSAELGYWIGKPFWGKGYGTEAAQAVLQFGFEPLKLNRIYANYFTHNPASGRIMEKIGMKFEGCLREHVHKWGKNVDINVYGILNREFKKKLEK